MLRLSKLVVVSDCDLLLNKRSKSAVARSHIQVIEPLNLDPRVSGVNLQLEITLTFSSGVARATHDGEGVWIADLLVELDLLTEDLQVRDACLRHERALFELRHKLALETSNHPADEVLALEGAGNIAVLLSHRDVG